MAKDEIKQLTIHKDNPNPAYAEAIEVINELADTEAEYFELIGGGKTNPHDSAVRLIREAGKEKISRLKAQCQQILAAKEAENSKSSKSQ